MEIKWPRNSWYELVSFNYFHVIFIVSFFKGIHVNVTEGSPILPIDAVPTLVNANGFMFGKDKFLDLLNAGSIDLRQVSTLVTNDSTIEVKYVDAVIIFI